MKVNTNFSISTFAKSTVQQGWRNVFTTGLAKFDHKDYVIKCGNFMNIEIYLLYYNVIIIKCYYYSQQSTL